MEPKKQPLDYYIFWAISNSFVDLREAISSYIENRFFRVLKKLENDEVYIGDIRDFSKEVILKAVREKSPDNQDLIKGMSSWADSYKYLFENLDYLATLGNDYDFISYESFAEDLRRQTLDVFESLESAVCSYMKNYIDDLSNEELDALETNKEIAITQYKNYCTREIFNCIEEDFFGYFYGVSELGPGLARLIDTSSLRKCFDKCVDDKRRIKAHK